MASKNIRGITIEIGGDTTKLGKALENSEKKSRSLQVELREIQNSLKFNPNNVELLTQKQEVLTQSISETSSKLDTLKEAEKQVIAQFQRGEVAEEQVRALQREILKTENQLDSMTSELTATNTALKNIADGTDKAEQEVAEYKDALDKAGEELDDFKEKTGETFEALGKGIAVLGASTVAVAGYATNLSIEFDKAFNNLQAQTGATAEEMAELEESVKNIYKANMGENMADVANSMALVKQQTNLTGKELENVTYNALLMRDTFGFEVNESIRAVNSMMNQFGISADEAYNLIAQGAQNGLNQNGDLMDVINEYSNQFATAGYSAEDMFNMLNNGVEAGTWSVDKLGDAVKEFNIRMSDGSAKDAVEALGFSWDSVSEKWAKGGDDAKDVMNMLMEELGGLENTTEGYNIGVGLMGTMFEDLGYDAVKALSDTEGAISSTSDALDDINDIKYDDLGSALQGLKRELETDVIDPLGDELKPVVEEAIEYVKENAPSIKETLTNITTAIGNFVKLVVDNGSTIISIIAGIGAGFVAWKITQIIGALIPLFTSLIPLITGGATAFKALDLAMKTNVIGIIVTAIVGLVTAFILLWKNCEGFRNFWIGLWEGIKSAFSAFIEWISPAIDSIKEFFIGLWESLQEIWTAIVDYLTPIIESIVGAFQEGWELIKVIWDLVYPFFLAIWEGIKTIFSVVKPILEMYFKNAWEAIKLVWSVVVSYFTTIWENIKAVFSVVKTFFSGMFSTAWEAIKAVWNVATAYFTTIWDTIKGVFSVVKNVLTGNWRDAWEGIKGIVNTWVGFFSTVWTNIKNVFSGVKSWFSSTFSSAWEAVKSVFSSWGSFFSGLWTKIKTTFSTIGTNISNAISSSVKAGLNGVISAIEGIINKGIGLINGAIGVINDIPGVSISKLSTLDLPRLARGGVVRGATTAIIGEDGAEAIVPLENNTEWLKNVARILHGYEEPNQNIVNGALASKMDEMIQTMKTLKSSIVLDTGVLVGETINQIDEQLGNNYALRARRV